MAANCGTSGSFQLPGKATSFAQVHFVCIPETFTAGADVHCSFVISEDLEINSHDWVGLYKVGWRSSSDYVYYEWSPVPSNYIHGTEVKSRILFTGNVVFHHNSLFNISDCMLDSYVLKKLPIVLSDLKACLSQ